MKQIKLDLHVHSIYSGDSLIKPADLIQYSKRRGLNGFAITDHDNFKAYRILKKLAKNQDLIVIPGMEIETHIGEVIGLFIEDEIDVRDNNFYNIIDQIRQNDGLVVVPHPFDFLRNNHLKMDLLNDQIIKKCIDGIEIMNSRIIIKTCVKKAEKFCTEHHLFETGGSDAHTKREIGKGYTLIHDVDDLSLDAIKKCLISRKSESKGKLSNPLVHAITVMNKIKKGLYL